MKERPDQAIAADYLFDGITLHEHSAVLLDGPRIFQILPRGQVHGIFINELPKGIWLAPGFVDIQVNGGGDILLNDAPDVETVLGIAAAHRKFGTTGLLPTLITDHPEKMALALAATREAIRIEPAILGLHLEGPFISHEKPGVHDPSFIRQPIAADLEILTGGHEGALVITLAPECVPASFIEQLVASDIRVCLGHSMATYAETKTAIHMGLRGFTHLFNAMRPMTAREPGPILAALESAPCSYGLIVDGVHVDAPMLQLALRGEGNAMLVTDAMPPVGGKRSTFSLYGKEMFVRGGRCVRSDGTLAGALLDMSTAVRNCVRLLGQPLERALRMSSTNPGAFLGLKVGRLAPGYRADMIALDPDRIQVQQTWIAGIER